MSNFSTKRVLITGLSGFTGKYLCEEMTAAGYQVFGTTLAEKPASSNIFSVDLCDRAVLIDVIKEIRPNLVAHLAGISFIGHGDPSDFYRVHLLGTRNLLEALAQVTAEVHGVLLASSAYVYGNAVSGVVPESFAPNPGSDYAVSKLAMESMSRLWMDKLPIFITRPFNCIGLGQNESFLLPKIVAHFKRRAQFIELGNLDVWRDFSDVRVVARLYRQLLEISPAGRSINICSGTTHSLREVLSIAEGITGHRVEVRVNPEFVRANEAKSFCGDTALLKSLIGDWEQPTLDETLRWMLEAPLSP